MPDLLSENDVINTITNKNENEKYTVKVLGNIGEGTQGTIYKIEWETVRGAGKYALKWYSRANIADQKEGFYENLQWLVGKEPPSQSFLWPTELTERQSDGTYGYVMDLAPEDYVLLAEILTGSKKMQSLGAVINAAVNIAKSFKLLHREGCSYQDINDRNFLIHPKNGDVMICDCENIAPDGENFGIKGTVGYMAPEVLLDAKPPDTQTDLFSMAVILFRLLFGDHPLEGKKAIGSINSPLEIDEIADRNNYGIAPLFVFDPHDDSNRPLEGHHRSVLREWPRYPQFVRDIFIRAFGSDMMKGRCTKNRIMESTWIEVFLGLRDIVIPHDCEYEIFVDPQNTVNKCIFCGNEIRRLPKLRFAERLVPLYPKVQLLAYQIGYKDRDCFEPVGIIAQNKRDQNKWAVKNLSNRKWSTATLNGQHLDVDNGNVVAVAPGICIDFGNGVSAEIVE